MRVIFVMRYRLILVRRYQYANPHAVTSVGGTSLHLRQQRQCHRDRLSGLHLGLEESPGERRKERRGHRLYGYDHAGQRVFQATGTATTSYPSKYFNLATTTGAATTTKHIFSPDGTLLATVVGASTTATTTYLHPDHLGGTNVATDEDGEVAEALDYYLFGSQRLATGSFDEQRRLSGRNLPHTAS